MKEKLRLCLTLLVFGILQVSIALGQLQTEHLGKPVRTAVPIEFVTRDSQTGTIAWAGFVGAERYGVVGIHTETGDVTEIDLRSYGETSTAVLIFKHSDRQFFIFAGHPGRFFRYDIPLKKLTPVGEATKATFWHNNSITSGKDGHIYVGTYPRATVVSLNPQTGVVKTIEEVAVDRTLQHVGRPQCADDGILYIPIGMKKGQLWSYNLVSGEKRQILPESLQTYGYPVLWKGEDGKVYGKKDTTVFVCSVSGVQPVHRVQPVAEIPDNEANGKVASQIDRYGRLILRDKQTRKRIEIQTSFQNPEAGLYKLGDVRDGKLYGSSYKPGNTFTFDLRTGKFEDLGILTSGRIQVYDYLSHESGIFMSSYTGGHIDLYPAGQELIAKNRKHIVNLHATENQERPRQMVTGPDGMVYCISIPLKGMLGGCLTRVDPKTLAVTSYKDTELIPHQSYTSVIPVPEKGELFITSSVGGGTGAKPLAKEAYVFLWDTKAHSISFRAQPLPGVSSYGNATKASNGVIYGFAKNQYYAFDTQQRKTIFTGTLPNAEATTDIHVIFCKYPAPNGMLYGVDVKSGRIFFINPADHSIHIVGRDATLKDTRFARVYQDGYLYYGYHAALMRVKVSDPGIIN